LAPMTKEGRRGSAIDPMPKGAFGHPDGHPRRGGRPFGLWEPLREGRNPDPLPSLAKRLAPPHWEGRPMT
jgi:hypothetical protein